MIELNVEDYCQECKHFEPDISKIALSADWNAYYLTVISCQNRAICEPIRKYLEEVEKARTEQNSQEKHTS